jgi:hypothetical protein
MDDWFGRLAWLIVSRIIEALSRSFVAWMRQEFEGYYSRNLRVTLGDIVSVSDVALIVQKIPAPSSVPAPKKLSAAEDLFWWYCRIHLS